MLDKRKQLKRAFCEKGNLHEYRVVVESLIDKILDSNCLISDCDICETSVIEQSNDKSLKNHIRISFKYKKAKPIHLIWDILHEFGHHLCGHPNGKEKNIERESEAWDKGELILFDYPLLLEEKSDYIVYRNKCLETYKRNEI